MTTKAAFSLFNSTSITSTVEVEVDLSAFASAQLLVSADAGNPDVISYDLREVDPITGAGTGGQPLGIGQNISPGGLQRFQFAVPSIRYRLAATSNGAPSLFTATIVAMA